MAHISYIVMMCVVLFVSIFGQEVEKANVSEIVLQEKAVIKVADSDLPNSSADKKRKVIVNNTITQKDLGYYKFFMTHYPSEFYIHVNGNMLSSKQQLIVDEPRLTITYFYEWSSPMGKVKKNKTLIYDIDQNTEKIDLSFTSWKEDDPRIKAPGCTLVSITEVEETNTIPKEKVNQFIAQTGQK
jgi:hypothetical protein